MADIYERWDAAVAAEVKARGCGSVAEALLFRSVPTLDRVWRSPAIEALPKHSMVVIDRVLLVSAEGDITHAMPITPARLTKGNGDQLSITCTFSI